MGCGRSSLTSGKKDIIVFGNNGTSISYTFTTIPNNLNLDHIWWTEVSYNTDTNVYSIVNGLNSGQSRSNNTFMISNVSLKNNSYYMIVINRLDKTITNTEFSNNPNLILLPENSFTSVKQYKGIDGFQNKIIDLQGYIQKSKLIKLCPLEF